MMDHGVAAALHSDAKQDVCRLTVCSDVHNYQSCLQKLLGFLLNQTEGRLMASCL